MNLSPQKLRVLTRIAKQPHRVFSICVGNPRTWWSLETSGHVRHSAIRTKCGIVICDGFQITAKGLDALKMKPPTPPKKRHAHV